MSEFTLGRPLRIAVDLTPLRAGGENGGVKPFIFEYLKWLGTQEETPIKLFLLTKRSSHAEVRPLKRLQDQLLCVVDDGEGQGANCGTESPSEVRWYNAPSDLLERLMVDVLYCPFGMCTWSHPGIPTMATIVDVLHRDYPTSLEPPDVSFREAFFRNTTQIADRFHTISAFTASRLIHHFRATEGRVYVSPIVIHSRLHKSKAMGKSSSRSTPYFLFPANAWRHKNHDGLFQAYARYHRKAGGNAWDLVLTGYPNAAMGRLQKAASDLGIGQQVRFLGYVPDHCFAQIWTEAGALVFPSLHEGFGIPLLEAMEFGLPILSSNAGALPEVGGNACLYVNATDPAEIAEGLSRISTDADLRSELIKRGKDRLQAYSSGTELHKFLKNLIITAKTPARFTIKGFDEAGLIVGQAFVALPRWNLPSLLELDLEATSGSTRLIVSHSGSLIGSAMIPSGELTVLKFPVFPEGRPISLSVQDPQQAIRACNTFVREIRLADGKGNKIVLFSTSQ